MHRVLLAVLTAAALLAATTAPAQSTDANSDRDRAERTLDRSRRLRLIGGIGAGMSLAAGLLWEGGMFEPHTPGSLERASGTGKALAIGGVTALGLGLIGDFARYRSKSRLDALDRIAAGSLDRAARDEVEQALRQGRRLSPEILDDYARSAARDKTERALRQARRLRVVGDVGAAMALAMPFFPDRFCGPEAESCSPAAKAYMVGGIAAGVVGFVGMIKTSRAESRLEVLDEARRASHQIGVAPLRDGVAANYSVAW